MASIVIAMPNGGDEHIDPQSALIVRPLFGAEIAAQPGAGCALLLPMPLFPAESLVGLTGRLVAEGVKLAGLTSPFGGAAFVNAVRVTDRDEPLSTDHPETRSVLLFGPGATAFRFRVRETKDEIRSIWTGLGLAPPFP